MTACPFSGLAGAMLTSELWNGAFFKRLEQPNGTKEATVGRPLYSLLFIGRLFLFKPKIIVLDGVFQ